MSVKHFRLLGFIEGSSLLLLLFVAMPLKYYAGIPEAVRIIGGIHGGLFLLYVFGVAQVSDEMKWSYGRGILACVVASIPFGPFIFDKVLFPNQSVT